MNYNTICVEVSPAAPRIVVSTNWASVPVGEQRLYVRRYGETDPFAYYPAIEANAVQTIFQVDELLFDKGPGRYEATLYVSTVAYSVFQLNYKAPNCLIGVENSNV